jgi:RNA polymerase sigma-70 factor (ECF subfamily)
VQETSPLHALVAAAREGDDHSLTRLVRALQPKVWATCRALGHGLDAEDLAQETFIRMIRALPGFRGESSVETWVLTIARRTCIDHVRKAARRRRLTERLVAQPHEEGREDRHRVETDDALSALSPERHEAFVLTQFVGLSYEEAAEVLGCPVGTIRSRVSRAREDLLALHLRSDAV